VDVVLTDDGKTAIAKNMRSFEVLDLAIGKVTQTLALPAGGGKGRNVGGAMSATGLIAYDGKLYVTDSQAGVMVAKKGDGNKYEWDGEPMKLPAPEVKGATYPTGLDVDGSALWVCSSRGNGDRDRTGDTGTLEAPRVCETAGKTRENERQRPSQLKKKFLG